VLSVEPKVRLITLAWTLTVRDITITEFNNCFSTYIHSVFIIFRQTVICRGKNSGNDLKYHNNSIKIFEISSAYLKKSAFCTKKHSQKRHLFMLFFLGCFFVYLKNSLIMRKRQRKSLPNRWFLYVIQNHTQKHRSFMLFFLVFIREYKATACDNIAQRWFKQQIAVLSHVW
jgi:hypothetical protein